jgi:hypothetical protein
MISTQILLTAFVLTAIINMNCLSQEIDLNTVPVCITFKSSSPLVSMMILGIKATNALSLDAAFQRGWLGGVINQAAAKSERDTCHEISHCEILNTDLRPNASSRS